MARPVAVMAILALYAVSFVLAAALLSDSGNRYSWMTDIDPSVTTLPSDGDGTFRVIFYAFAGALSAAAGLLCTSFLGVSRLRAAARLLGMLLLLLVGVLAALRA